MLIMGNVAKLYCLNWIAEQAEANPNLSILDLGCGTGSPFVELLNRYSHVRYVGIEPMKERCEVARQNLPHGTVVNEHAYDVYNKIQEQFDIVVSFSALEHVFKRREYLRSAKACLKSDGRFLINYDSGHFVVIQGGRTTRKESFMRRLQAHLGNDTYFRAFVKEKEFQNLVEAVGFQICEAKSFNSWLKSIYKFTPDASKEEYMQRWLEFELWLNETGISYDDDKASYLLTRNYIIKHAPVTQV